MNVYKILNWYYSLEKETKVDLLETSTNSKFEIGLFKQERGLYFKLENNNHRLLYGKETNFLISHNLLKINILHFIEEFDNENQIRYCNAYMFKSISFDEEVDKYHCYYSNINKFHFKELFQTYNKEFSIILNGIKFKITSRSISPDINNSFLCIECYSKISFKKFKHFVNNIIVSLGFFSGRFFKLEEFYFQSTNIDYSEEVEFFYRNSNKKYRFPQPFTIRPSVWEWKFQEGFQFTEKLMNKWSSELTDDILNKLVNLLIEKPKIYYSIKMILDFYSYPIISRPSLMFVILETICKDFLDIISPPIESIAIKDEAKKILIQYEDIIPNEDFETLLNAINKIDRKIKGNIVNFEKVFALLKIKLSQEDKDVLIKRNVFFHGEIIPSDMEIIDEESQTEIEEKYFMDSIRLYILIAKLILKKVEFRGCLINYTRLYGDEFRVKSNEDYFIKL